MKDPNAPLSSKHEKTVRNIIKNFMDKAVKKRTERQRGKAERAENKNNSGYAQVLKKETSANQSGIRSGSRGEERDEIMAQTGEDGDAKSNNVSPTDSSSGDLKRKREEGEDVGSPKKSKTEESHAPPPPPPPPPSDSATDGDESTMTPVGEGIGANEADIVNDMIKERPGHGESPWSYATPPTNGSTHNGFAGHQSDRKRSVTLDGGD